MQRGLSSFDIYVIISELQELIGSYIDKIYQTTRDELLIRINNKKTGQKETIFVKNEKLLCTTQKKFGVPKKPSTFAMTMSPEYASFPEELLKIFSDIVLPIFFSLKLFLQSS